MMEQNSVSAPLYIKCTTMGFGGTTFSDKPKSQRTCMTRPTKSSIKRTNDSHRNKFCFQGYLKKTILSHKKP